VTRALDVQKYIVKKLVKKREEIVTNFATLLKGCKLCYWI